VERCWDSDPDTAEELYKNIDELKENFPASFRFDKRRPVPGKRVNLFDKLGLI
jgi:hypothetical protein